MSTITEDQLDSLRSFLDIEDDDVRRDYSGRGMYGESCIGFVIDIPDVSLGVALCAVLGESIAVDMARDAQADSMGRSTIVYFPGWKVEVDDE